MSHLLITTLGAAGNASSLRYRLPFGDRIAETAHVGTDLAPLIGAKRIDFVAASPAAFASLLDLVPAAVADAPIPDLRRDAPEAPAAETLPEASTTPAVEAPTDGSVGSAHAVTESAESSEVASVTQAAAEATSPETPVAGDEPAAVPAVEAEERKPVKRRH